MQGAFRLCPPGYGGGQAPERRKAAADLREMQENQGFSENRIDKPEFADHLEDSLFGKGVLRFPAFDFVAW